MIKKQNLLICPQCQENGTHVVLAELLPNGVKIMQQRFDKRAVIIVADSFSVICSQCRELAFVKTERRVIYENNTALGSFRFHRETSLDPS